MSTASVEVATVDPIFIDVKNAARLLAVSTWQVYALCDNKELDSRYVGRKRLITYRSLLAYAEGLPTVAPTSDDAA